MLSISMILLLFAANYLTFTVARSLSSTYQGYQEMRNMDQDGTFIANLDPDSDPRFDEITLEKIQEVYDYLSNNYTYALYADGFIVSLPNDDDIEISLNYINRESYVLNQFELSDGSGLYFDYELNENEIPVLIGKGLSRKYPVGSTIEISDPVLERSIVLKVQGVLKQNAYHSNFYALNSKTYYNFSIFIPVNEDFLRQSNIDLYVNALMDIAVLQSTREETANLSEYIQNTLGLKFNFFSQDLERFSKHSTNAERFYNQSVNWIKLFTAKKCVVRVFWHPVLH